jgi:hypothetical protein
VKSGAKQHLKLITLGGDLRAAWLAIVLLVAPHMAGGQPQPSMGQVTDPSFLTTQQLLRVNEALKELLFTKLDAIKARLDAADKAVQLLHQDVTRVPTDVDKSVGHLKELVFQKLGVDYDGIELQFKERDTRVDQTAKDSKVAVDAALSAAKEAVGEQNKSSALAIAKQEATFTKQIDQLSVLLATVTKGQEDKINDIKAALSAYDGRSRGIGDSWGVIVGAIGIMFGLIGVIALFFRTQAARTVEVVRDAVPAQTVRMTSS